MAPRLQEIFLTPIPPDLILFAARDRRKRAYRYAYIYAVYRDLPSVEFNLLAVPRVGLIVEMPLSELGLLITRLIGTERARVILSALSPLPSCS